MLLNSFTRKHLTVPKNYFFGRCLIKDVDFYLFETEHEMNMGIADDFIHCTRDVVVKVLESNNIYSFGRAVAIGGERGNAISLGEGIAISIGHRDAKAEFGGSAVALGNGCASIKYGDFALCRGCGNATVMKFGYGEEEHYEDRANKKNLAICYGNGRACNMRNGDSIAYGEGPSEARGRGIAYTWNNNVFGKKPPADNIVRKNLLLRILRPILTYRKGVGKFDYINYKDYKSFD